MTLRFAEIQQELKVAAAECRAAWEFKRFEHAYKRALDLSDQAMLNVFRDNSVGNTGTSAYAAFKAQLVSNSLLRSARNKATFCAEARSEYAAALAGDGALETLISSSQPYVDIPFRDCSENPQPADSAIVAQQTSPQSVTRQIVQVAEANVAENPLVPPAIRPDPSAEIAAPTPNFNAADLVHVVPNHAPLVPATPALTRPAGVAVAAPQFEIAAPPALVMFARIVPHHAPFVPSVPAMAAPTVQAVAAPRFAITQEPEPVMITGVVPHAPFVPSVADLTAPEAQVAAAPRVAIAPETAPVVIARVVPHHARFVPSVPAMAAPEAQLAAAPRFAIASEPASVEIARVVPHHARFVPSVPVMTAPATQATTRAPRFAIMPESEPMMMARVVPHHSRFVPSVPAMTAPEAQTAAAPRFAVAPEAAPVEIARAVPRRATLAPSEASVAQPRLARMGGPDLAVARVEEDVVNRHLPRHSALRSADLVFSHPRAATADTPEVAIARAAPPTAPAPMRAEVSDSAIVRGLARLSAIAAAMIKREAAADAAEPAAPTRPMVGSAKPAPHQAGTDVAQVTVDDLAVVAARAADVLRGAPDPHPERRIAARQSANSGTTHRRMIAATLIVPAKRGVPLSSLNPTIEVGRVDQVTAAPAHPAQAPDAVPAQTTTNDQSAVIVAARADVPASKIMHGYSAGKATTYGMPPKPADAPSRANGGNDANNTNTATAPAPVEVPSASLMPRDQDQDQNSNPDQNGDQQAGSNGGQDDQYGQTYAYDDGYARARARARAWRRRLIDAYETYRRRSVPEDYSGDYPPPPPPWRNDSGDDSWSDR